MPKPSRTAAIAPLGLSLRRSVGRQRPPASRQHSRARRVKCSSASNLQASGCVRLLSARQCMCRCLMPRSHADGSVRSSSTLPSLGCRKAAARRRRAGYRPRKSRAPNAGIASARRMARDELVRHGAGKAVGAALGIEAQQMVAIGFRFAGPQFGMAPPSGKGSCIFGLLGHVRLAVSSCGAVKKANSVVGPQTPFGEKMHNNRSLPRDVAQHKSRP